MLTRKALDTSPLKNQAPVIAWEHMRQLAEYLWIEENPKNKGSKYNRKQAATMIFITAFSGARWIDAARLKWEDMRVLTREHRKFVQIYIRISKTNIEGTSLEAITLPHLPDSTNCPVKALTRWWIYTGKPTAGFIFPCHKFGLFNYSNYTDGRAAHRNVTAAAEKLGWSVKPFKHTNRKTASVTLAALNVDRLALTRHLRWQPNSPMPDLYIGLYLTNMQNAPASILASNIEQNRLECQRQFALSPK